MAGRGRSGGGHPASDQRRPTIAGRCGDGVPYPRIAPQPAVRADRTVPQRAGDDFARRGAAWPEERSPASRSRSRRSSRRGSATSISPGKRRPSARFMTTSGIFVVNAGWTFRPGKPFEPVSGRSIASSLSVSVKATRPQEIGSDRFRRNTVPITRSRSSRSITRASISSWWTRSTACRSSGHG